MYMLLFLIVADTLSDASGTCIACLFFTKYIMFEVFPAPPLMLSYVGAQPTSDEIVQHTHGLLADLAVRYAGESSVF
jgi:hypothetical protein